MRHDIEALRRSQVTDKATFRERLLGSASPIAAAAHKPAPGFRVRKSTWQLIRAFAKQPRRALGYLARRLFYKSKRRIRRMREAIKRAADRLSRPSATANQISRGSAPSTTGLLALEPRIVFDAAAGATAEQTADQVAQQQAEAIVDSPQQAEAAEREQRYRCLRLHRGRTCERAAPRDRVRRRLGSRRRADHSGSRSDNRGRHP